MPSINWATICPLAGIPAQRLLEAAEHCLTLQKTSEGLFTVPGLDVLGSFSYVPNVKTMFATRAHVAGSSVCYYLGQEADISTGVVIHMGRGIHVVPYPELHHDHPAGVAQLVQDGAVPFFEGYNSNHPKSQTVALLASGMVRYMAVSRARANLQAHPTLPSVYVASRTIEIGEELFIHHGVLFWYQECVARYRVTWPELAADLTWVFNQWLCLVRTKEAQTRASTRSWPRRPRLLNVMMRHLTVAVQQEAWMELSTVVV